MIRWRRSSTDGRSWFLSSRDNNLIVLLCSYTFPAKGWYVTADQFGIAHYHLTDEDWPVPRAKAQALAVVRKHVMECAEIVGLSITEDLE